MTLKEIHDRQEQEHQKVGNIEVRQLEEDEIEELGVKDWPIWEKEASTFDWEYDKKEECYLLEGEVVVETPEGSTTIGKGDFVTFPKGLECTWYVEKPVRKHYRLEE